MQNRVFYSDFKDVFNGGNFLGGSLTKIKRFQGLCDT